MSLQSSNVFHLPHALFFRSAVVKSRRSVTAHKSHGSGHYDSAVSRYSESPDAAKKVQIPETFI